MTASDWGGCWSYVITFNLVKKNTRRTKKTDSSLFKWLGSSIFKSRHRIRFKDYTLLSLADYCCQRSRFEKNRLILWRWADVMLWRTYFLRWSINFASILPAELPVKTIILIIIEILLVSCTILEKVTILKLIWLT